MKRNILCCFVLSSVLLLTGCQKTPRAEARSELAELGLEVTQGAYIDAVDGGDAVVVELFLAAGMSQNLVYSSGKTVLIRAAEEGQPAVAEKLLEAGARLETWDDEGWNALMKASWNGHVEVVRLLLDAGADINSRKKGKYTIMLSDPYEFNQGGTPLLAAVANNEEVMATSLLESGADFSLRDAQGLSALDVAAQNGFLEIVKALLSVGAEVNAKNANGLTPIYRASDKGHTKAIQRLLDSGADPDVALRDGMTPLIVAASNNHYGAVEALLEAGVEVNKRDGDGRTAFDYAKNTRRITVDIHDLQSGNPRVLRSVGGVRDLLKEAGATE